MLRPGRRGAIGSRWRWIETPSVGGNGVADRSSPWHRQAGGGCNWERCGGGRRRLGRRRGRRRKRRGCGERGRLAASGGGWSQHRRWRRAGYRAARWLRTRPLPPRSWRAASFRSYSACSASAFARAWASNRSRAANSCRCNSSRLAISSGSATASRSAASACRSNSSKPPTCACSATRAWARRI